MNTVVSPYHLTTREPPAMASLLLATRVVTMIPAPFRGDDRASVTGAAARIPRYLDLMESWSWAMPLFREGLIGTLWNGEDMFADVCAVFERIRREPGLSGLRPLMREELLEHEGLYLDAIARDLLRGGPDPALSVPVAAALDAFAARHSLVVARASPSSVVQKVEARMGERGFAVSVPVLVQASAGRLLEAREVLDGPLDAFRGAVESEIEVHVRGGEPDAERVRDAASDYAGAFRREAGFLLSPEDDPDEVRAVEGLITLTGMLFPVDAVLRSSLGAMRVLARRPARGVVEPLPETAGTAPSIMVKVVGR